MSPIPLRPCSPPPRDEQRITRHTITPIEACILTILYGVFGFRIPTLREALCCFESELESILSIFDQNDENSDQIDEENIVRRSSNIAICLQALGLLHNEETISYVSNRDGSLMNLDYTTGNIYEGTETTQTIRIPFRTLVETIINLCTYSQPNYVNAIQSIIGEVDEVEQE